MNDQIRNRYLYGGVSKEEFDHVRQDILDHNRKRLLVYILISVIILGIMVVITSLFPSLGFSPIPYLFPLSLILPIYLYLKKKRSSAEKIYKRRPHVVKAGESMYDIAQKYGIRLKYLYKKNKLQPDYMPRVGDVLKVY